MSKVILVKMEKQKFRNSGNVSNAWDQVLNERVTLQNQI